MPQAAERERVEAECERAEELAYQEWSQSIAVTDVGHEVLAPTQEEALNEKLIDQIQCDKVVELAEVAATLGIRTRECIDRVRKLESSGRLTGVFDDRGKFIHISDTEMQRFAAFIQDHGRVRLEDLAAQSPLLMDPPGSPAVQG